MRGSLSTKAPHVSLSYSAAVNVSPFMIISIFFILCSSLLTVGVECVSGLAGDKKEEAGPSVGLDCPPINELVEFGRSEMTGTPIELDCSPLDETVEFGRAVG